MNAYINVPSWMIYGDYMNSIFIQFLKMVTTFVLYPYIRWMISIYCMDNIWWLLINSMFGQHLIEYMVVCSIHTTVECMVVCSIHTTIEYMVVCSIHTTIECMVVCSIHTTIKYMVVCSIHTTIEYMVVCRLSEGRARQSQGFRGLGFT
jgi:hypothetical protein